jgi:hypothetical protein
MGVLINDFPQMTPVQNHQVIQTCLANRTHPSLGNSIGPGSSTGRQHNGEALRSKNGIEGCGEFGIAVVDEKAHGTLLVGETPKELPCLLGNPRAIWGRSAAGEVDSA